MGDFDMNTWSYPEINYDNIDFAKDTVQGILDKWGEHPALAAIEPVNEPWWSSDYDVLTQFYRDVK